MRYVKLNWIRWPLVSCISVCVLIRTTQLTKWITVFLPAESDDKNITVRMCIPEIETKLKGFSTFQTQAFAIIPILGRGEFGAGVGYSLQVLFLCEMSCLAPSLWEEAIKVAKSYLAWRPWTISLLWRTPFKLHSFYHVDLLTQDLMIQSGWGQ